jgi:hypothetical protein
VKTVFVRAVPDASTSVISVQTTSVDRLNRLLITFTPKTKFGNLMGPGFANYLWFTSPGRPMFKAVDDLKGSYTATLDYSGSAVPSVGLVFYDVSILIGDDVPPDRLPPAADGTTVFGQIPGTGNQATGCLVMIVTLIKWVLKKLGL